MIGCVGLEKRVCEKEKKLGILVTSLRFVGHTVPDRLLRSGSSSEAGWVTNEAGISMAGASCCSPGWWCCGGVATAVMWLLLEGVVERPSYFGTRYRAIKDGGEITAVKL